MSRRYNADWSRKKAYLIRSLFHEIPPTALSPVPEESSSVSDSEISVPKRPYSPLPDLIIEKEPNKHDEPEEFYQKLEIKMKRIYRKVFIEGRSISDCDLSTTECIAEDSRTNSEDNTSSFEAHERNCNSEESDDSFEQSNVFYQDYGMDVIEEANTTYEIERLSHSTRSKEVQSSTNNDSLDSNGYIADADTNISDSETQPSRSVSNNNDVSKDNSISERHDSTESNNNVVSNYNQTPVISDKTNSTADNIGTGGEPEIIDLDPSYFENNNESNKNDAENTVHIGFDDDVRRSSPLVGDYNLERDEDIEMDLNNDEVAVESLCGEGPVYMQITTQAQIHVDGATEHTEKRSQVYDEIVRPPHGERTFTVPSIVIEGIEEQVIESEKHIWSETESDVESTELEENIGPAQTSTPISEHSTTSHDSVEQMRSLDPQPFRHSIEHNIQHSSNESNTNHVTPPLEWSGRWSQDAAVNNNILENEENNFNDILSTILNQSVNKTPISRKRRALQDISVQTSGNTLWDDLRGNFFVGSPKILRLCSCAGHICRQ